MAELLHSISQYLTLDLIGKLAAGVVGALGAIYQFSQLRASTRSSIKTDLDILALLDKEGTSYRLVKASVDASISQVYAARGKSAFTVYSKGDLVFGTIFLVGFSAWTAYLVHNGSTWWAIITAFFAFAGFGGILNAFDPKRQKTKAATEPSPEPNA